jgi:hypothetical protein
MKEHQIIKEPETIALENIPNGECFEFNNIIYLKTNVVSSNILVGINIVTGESCSVSCKTQVIARNVQYYIADKGK